MQCCWCLNTHRCMGFISRVRSLQAARSRETGAILDSSLSPQNLESNLVSPSNLLSQQRFGTSSKSDRFTVICATEVTCLQAEGSAGASESSPHLTLCSCHHQSLRATCSGVMSCQWSWKTRQCSDAARTHAVCVCDTEQHSPQMTLEAWRDYESHISGGKYSSSVQTDNICCLSATSA